MNIEHTEITCREQDSVERCCGLLLWCGGRALGHLEMMTIVAFQSYVILDAQKQTKPQNIQQQINLIDKLS